MPTIDGVQVDSTTYNVGGDVTFEEIAQITGPATPLPVMYGGTGADNVEDARNSLGVDAAGIASMITTTYTNTSSTSESLTYINENHTVSGNGVVWVTATISTDDTNTYGTTQAYILWNFNTMARTQIRYPSAIAQGQASSVSVAIKVSDGDTITLRMGSTRGGTKYFYRVFTCLGCTVS